MKKVCWRCFADGDIAARIKAVGERNRCDYCGKRGIRCCDFSDISEFICERFSEYFSRAVDELPFDSAEGGYLGTTYDSYDLIDDYALVADDGELRDDLIAELGDDIWCEYDWTSLELDVAYDHAWKRFCEAIKHKRRFFFSTFGHDPEDRDSLAPIEVLGILASWIDRLKLVKTLPVGTHVWRARGSNPGRPFRTPAELGPPPAEVALQANRMNPAGIPMFYAAAKEVTAAAETPGECLSLGRFRLLQDLRMVNLAGLPSVPGFFSNASKQERLTIKFLHGFRRDIELPVARDNGSHIEYLPSQVVTEFLRVNGVGGAPVDGVIYRSIRCNNDTNYVFFAEQGRIKNARKKQWFERNDPEWFLLVKRRLLTRSE